MKILNEITVKILLLGIICSAPLLLQSQELSPSYAPFHCGKYSVKTDTPPDTNIYYGSNYDITYCRAHWNVTVSQQYIQGDVTYYFNILVDQTEEIHLQLMDYMFVDSVLYRGNSIAYTHLNNELTIRFPRDLEIHSSDSVQIYYQGIPEDRMAYRSDTLQDGSAVLWTLSQPYGAKTWWPSKNVLNDKIDSLDVVIRVNSAEYKVASNGVLIDDVYNEKENHRTFHWRHRYPIATYLVGFAVADYKKEISFLHFNSGDSLRIENYYYPESEEEFRRAYLNLEQAFYLFDSLFCPYPFSREQYGQAQMTRGGGMEHQTMTFIGSWSNEVVAHEIAHQWFGNYLTLNDWRDIWLNEGFATYLTGLCYEMIPTWRDWWERWKEVVIDRATAQPDGSVYVHGMMSKERLFDSRLSYFKAAYLLHMLRGVVGDDSFFLAISSYLQDPYLQYSFCGQGNLLSYLEREYDGSLADFFDQWYYGEGYPSYHVEWMRLHNNKIRLSILQEQSSPKTTFFSMPLPIGFFAESRDTIIKFDHSFSGEIFIRDIGFDPEYIVIDPQKQILSKNNKVTFLPEPFSQPYLLVYPNPTDGLLIIESEMAVADFYITDMSGTVFIPGSVKESFFVARTHLSSLSSGLYLLHLQLSDGSIKVKKVLKY